MAMTAEQRAKRRAYYQKNREKILAYQKKWKAENPVKVAEYTHKTWKRRAELQQNNEV